MVRIPVPLQLDLFLFPPVVASLSVPVDPRSPLPRHNVTTRVVLVSLDLLFRCHWPRRIVWWFFCTTGFTTCGWRFGRGPVFVEGLSGCVRRVLDGGSSRTEINVPIPSVGGWATGKESRIGKEIWPRLILPFLLVPVRVRPKKTRGFLVLLSHVDPSPSVPCRSGR